MTLTKTHDRLADTQVEMAYAPHLGDKVDERERQHNVKMFVTVGYCSVMNTTWSTDVAEAVPDTTIVSNRRRVILSTINLLRTV